MKVQKKMHIFISQHFRTEKLSSLNFPMSVSLKSWRFSKSLWLHKNLNILFSDPSRLGTGGVDSVPSASGYCHSGRIATSTNEQYIFADIFKSKNLCIFTCFLLSSLLIQFTLLSEREKKILLVFCTHKMHFVCV